MLILWCLTAAALTADLKSLNPDEEVTQGIKPAKSLPLEGKVPAKQADEVALTVSDNDPHIPASSSGWRTESCIPSRATPVTAAGRNSTVWDTMRSWGMVHLHINDLVLTLA